MSTSMELGTTLSLLAAFLAILTIFFGAYHFKARFMRASDALKELLRDDLERASALLVDLRSAQARAAGTIRTAERRIGINPAAAVAEAAEEQSEGIPPMLASIAQGAGIDLQALAAGDPTQLQKIKDLLPAQKQQQHTAGLQL